MNLFTNRRVHKFTVPILVMFLTLFSNNVSNAQVAASCIPSCYNTGSGQSYYMYIPYMVINGTTYTFCSNMCSSCTPAPCAGADWGPGVAGANQVNTNTTIQSLPGATMSVMTASLNYVSSNYQYTNYGGYQSVSVDWNNNGVFTDAGEILTGTSYVTYGSTYTFTIPTTVTPGPKRFRVVSCYGQTSNLYTDPCSGASYQYYKDFKDFILNIGYNNDAALTTVKTQTPAPFAPGNNTIQAVVTNNGLNTLNSVQVNWSLNGVTQSPISYTTAITPGNTATVALVTQNFPQVGSLTVQAWTSLPNGTTDGNPANDLGPSVLFGAALNGTYTAGGGGSDFTGPKQAADQISAGGVLGPVTINI
ncbi:MAG: hypothetical protein JNJ85_09490, partial [Candidatus Kapabacteria bacterium]|nr:hypothetical protein [Candidatus Kapabacteria bacterium]